MTAKSLEIFDTALQISLWTFLLLLLISVLYITLQRAVSARRIASLHRESPESASPLLATTTDLRSALRAFCLSGIAAALLFLFLILTPLSPITNFVNSDSWKTTPLRLTELIFQRFSDGFSLEGKVYNQTEKAMEEIQVLVRVWGSDDKLIEEVPVQLDPLPLEPGEGASFSLRYRHDSPLLYGYDILFVDADAIEVPHSQGFDKP